MGDCSRSVEEQEHGNSRRSVVGSLVGLPREKASRGRPSRRRSLPRVTEQEQEPPVVELQVSNRGVGGEGGGGGRVKLELRKRELSVLS